MPSPKKRKLRPPLKETTPRNRAIVDEFGLNIRQRAFADHYLIDQNASTAYVKAGYVARNNNVAAANASVLIRNHKVSAYIEARLKKVLDKLEVTQERWLQEVARISFLDIRQAFDENGNLLPIKDIPEDVARALAGIEVLEEFEGEGKDRKHIGQTKKLKAIDKTGGLRLLGQYLKLLTDKIELSVPVPIHHEHEHRMPAAAAYQRMLSGK